MLIPLPEWLLNLLLVGNFILAILLLMSSLYISEPLKLSVLPTLLLLATLYRLALNISTTRLILGTGSAGEVIQAFGNVVIQGNLIVGAVVFLIITLVQFIVIAKGAERVAEVSARFTLDALPGKQMSIDADVRSGLIDSETAKVKREELQMESRFYGSLDGAMKFVKGDSIAGLIITAINVVGGLGIGILMHGLDISLAVQKYTLLTVGDGLLSQIPALLNATAAGIIVTRVTKGDDSSLAHDLMKQLTSLRKVQFITAAIAFVLALLPGLPFVPFMLVAVIISSFLFVKDEQIVKDEPELFKPKSLPVLMVELQSAVAKEVHEKGDLIQALERCRQKIFENSGIAIGRPFLAVNDQLTSSYRILLRGIEISQHNHQEKEIWDAVYDCVVKNKTDFIDDIMTRRLLDYFDNEAPELVSAVVPGVITVTQLTEILKYLSLEQISLRNFDQILQAIAEHGPKVSNERQLLEEVRINLKRTISAQYADAARNISGYALEPVIDLMFLQAEREGKEIDPSLIDYVEQCLQDLSDGRKIVFTSKGGRKLLHECLELRELDVVVLAHEEISSEFTVDTLGMITLPDAQEQREIAA